MLKAPHTMYGHMLPDRAPRRWVAAVAGGSLLVLLLGMLLFWLAAVPLRLVGDFGAQASELIPSLDPVYTHAALRSLADLHLQGVAVAGPPGDWLHQILPDFFVDSARAHWSPARVVGTKGTPVLARLVAAGL